MSGEDLLNVRGLRVDYGRGRGAVRAVDDVSLSVAPGETVGLVGESGSGKSTIGRAIVGLTPVAGGAITFAGEDITHARRGRRRELSASLQMVFQDPYSSLNPARTVGATLAEPLLARREISPRERLALVQRALERVGLPPEAARRYPAQFSGGQRQRIAIARTLVVSPRLVVCDEPVSALDLSIQAQVMNLLADLQAELGLSYLFIAHDLGVVRYLSQRVVVLYRGQVMESGPAAGVYSRPAHPYTQALIAAAPIPDPKAARARPAAAAPREQAERNLPSESCRFASRCRYVVDACTRQRPPLVPTRHGGLVACLRHEEIGAPAATDHAAPPRPDHANATP
ncbi:ABC transporter ATP-binding protein [Saccharothrix deserti]|uniref:ABC transporter ATP-binding protein n=1 Tax=Saccharothrix deserti TaxID=2593674 RepID=UPI00192E592B|nr:ABC transporter ATP-binding protein [Saccharothrix deserti]